MEPGSRRNGGLGPISRVAALIGSAVLVLTACSPAAERPTPPPTPPTPPTALTGDATGRTADVASPGTRPRAATRPPERVLTLRVLVDEEYRADRPEWKSQVERSIEAASAVLETSVALRLEPAAVIEWKSPDDAKDLYALHETLWLMDTRGADLVCAFTAQGSDAYSNPRGIAAFFGRRAMVRANPVRRGGRPLRPWPYVEETIVHEIAHVFGAWHVADPRSVMRVPKRAEQVLELGSLATRVLLRTRRCELSEGVTSLDPEVRQEISDLWCSIRGGDRLHPIARGLRRQAARETERGGAAGLRRAYARNREAIRLWDAAGIDDDTDLHDALVDAGQELQRRGRSAEAVRLLRRAVAMRPKLSRPEGRVAQANLVLGWIFLERGELEESARQCRIAVADRAAQKALDPQWLAEAHEYLGRALAGLRRRDEAARSYREALRLFDLSGQSQSPRRADVARRLRRL